MKLIKIMMAAGFSSAFACNLLAQTSTVTVTNFVTVTVTNIVTVTNFAAKAEVVAKSPAAPAPAPKKLAVPVRNPWQSSVSAGLTLVRGNTDTTLFSADFLTEKKTPSNEYKLGVSGAYGAENSQETVNNYKAFAQWDRFVTERFYGFLRTEGLRDYIADVDYRLTIGPGAGYYLLKGTNNTLAVEAGVNFEAQELGGLDQNFATVRLAERFEHKFNDRARLWQNVEIFPQVDKVDNYVVNFEIGVEAAISKTLSLKTCLDDSYANRPAAAHLKNDAKIIAGVAYKF
jgi:putative salt-induced outer membrane protein YdiY